MSETLVPVVFELGLNHMGDEGRALRMVNELKSQGATHITIQVLIDVASFTRNTSTIEFLQKHCLTFEQNLRVIHFAVNAGLSVGATVTNPDMVEPLLKAGVDFFKILSGDLSFDPLISKAAATGLPVYLSTGASTADEISRALEQVRIKVLNADLRLIHTVLVVPTPPDLLNLRNIHALSKIFDLPVSYGQHSDLTVAIELAVAAGAQSIFVYVAETRQPELPDGPHAIECSQAGALLERVRLAEKVMGKSERVISEGEMGVRVVARRSIVAAREIEKGCMVIEEDVTYKRPRSGLDPWDLHLVLGKKSEQRFEKGQDLTVGGCE